MRVFLLVLLVLLVLVIAGLAYGYRRMKRYLAQSEGRIEGVVSEIQEEIDGYQEKTQ
jgi:hypothetical protein